jgi:hypothetical protein
MTSNFFHPSLLLMFLDPGSGMGKNQDQGSGINIPDRNTAFLKHFLRLAVEDGLSFNQIATSEFLSLAFGHMGYRARKSHTSVAKDVKDFILAQKEETRTQLQTAFAKVPYLLIARSSVPDEDPALAPDPDLYPINKEKIKENLDLCCIVT